MYNLKDLKSYTKSYKKSVENPEAFWDAIAKANFVWKRPWSRVLEWDFSLPKISWF